MKEILEQFLKFSRKNGEALAFFGIAAIACGFLISGWLIAQADEGRRQLTETFGRELRLQNDQADFRIEKAKLEFEKAKFELEKSSAKIQKDFEDEMDSLKKSQQEEFEKLRQSIEAQVTSFKTNYESGKSAFEIEREKLLRFWTDIEPLLDELAKDLASLEKRALDQPLSAKLEETLLKDVFRSRVKLDVFLAEYRKSKLDFERRFQIQEPLLKWSSLDASRPLSSMLNNLSTRMMSAMKLGTIDFGTGSRTVIESPKQKFLALGMRLAGAIVLLFGVALFWCRARTKVA